MTIRNRLLSLWCRIFHYRKGWIVYPIFGAISPYVATCRKCARCYYSPHRFG